MLKLRELPLRRDDNDSKLWIILDDFIIYLKNNQSEKDRIKLLKKYNIKREVERYQGGHIKFVGGTECISTLAILKYIFNHSEDFENCFSIGNQISKDFFSSVPSNIDSQATLLDLYKQISNLLVGKDDHKYLEFDELQIPFLEHSYKVIFSKEEWSRICLFEHHFAQSLCSEPVVDSIKRRWDYLKSLKEAKNLSKSVVNSAQQTIKLRRQRITSNAVNEEIQLSTINKHRPAILDSQIFNAVTTIFPVEIQSITCIKCMCPGMQEFLDTIDIIVGCNRNCEAPTNKLTKQMILNICNKYHSLNCHHIMFIDSNSLTPYLQKNGQIARFILYDDLRLYKLNTHILFSCNVLQENVVPEEISVDGIMDRCQSCFDISMPKPLSATNFDILQEFHLEVPLEMQFILEMFINKDTLYHKNLSENFLIRKYERLYSVYEVLLNTFNKNFIGIFQQKITDELLMNYHSISTLFNVTSKYGFTTSLTFAENNLISKSMDDQLYYQTYIKEYPITYDTLAGNVTQMVSLRQCHLILMLDNLVRLKYHSDPDPGEHRSKQLCMLPITLQGLPKDSKATEYWHDLDICDGSQHCSCKKQLFFSKEEAFDTILNLSHSEQSSLEIFNKICRWGNNSLWRMLQDTTCTFPKTSWLNKFIQEAIVFNQEMGPNSTSLKPVEPVEELKSPDNSSPIPLIQISPDGLSSSDPLYTSGDNLHEIVHDTCNILDESMDLGATLDDSFLETSMEQLTLQETEHTQQSVLSMFGFEKFTTPPLLTRHPPPASGRDDDINKLREILDDILVKTGMDKNTESGPVSFDRILFGPDNKIGINLLSLIKENKKYGKFLPEFPLLHLRKSKVNTLFSAYRYAGLVELLMVMRDETTTEWSKLITTEHIDTATRHIRRLSQSLQLAFTLKFIQYLPSTDARLFVENVLNQTPIETAQKWNNKFDEFMVTMRKINATFALHYDMMIHCNEVVAVKLAERLGGENGYSLLLGAVKSSLWFSFLNGASSYAPYCTRLLTEHYTAGIFHQNLKKCLFSTPIGNSQVNFACDTKREMDHKDALKGFRSGSSQESAVRRMSLIDSFNAVHAVQQSDNDSCGVSWNFTETDVKHIFRVTEVILRQDALSTRPCVIPRNVYAIDKDVLSREILDDDTKEIGKYLIQRFICKDNLFQLSATDSPKLEDVSGPISLKSRLNKNLSVTIKRVIKQTKIAHKSERQLKEDKRSKLLSNALKQTDRLSSDMNMCQSLVKPDCSKPKVQKSSSMKLALANLLEFCNPHELNNCITTASKSLPGWLTKSVKIVTIEFAGVKFKTKVVTGSQYLYYVQNAVLCPIIKQMSALERVIVCEEKYSFTPDNFKASTRRQRKKTPGVSVVHLKSADDILNQHTFQRDAITGTDVGKSMISNYLASNIHKLKLPREITVDIDSEMATSCICGGACNCNKYAIPIRCQFTPDQTPCQITNLIDIHQKKGEAEMSQVDWLIGCKDKLESGDTIASFVTLGDIDAVIIHLFAVARHWPREENGHFKNDVYVILQKPQKKYDIFNITLILETLEKTFNSKLIGIKVPIGLCLGGNDFIPKIKGKSHDKILKMYVYNDHFLSSLIECTTQIQINPDIFEEFIKNLYCPKKMNPESVTSEDVRRITRERKKKLQSISSTDGLQLSNADNWMPPTSAIYRLANLIQLQIDYLLTAGDHSADLPDFMSLPCLKKSTTGEGEYDFGPDAFMALDSILKSKEGVKRKKTNKTPQKGQRRKRQLTSTPKKKLPK